MSDTYLGWTTGDMTKPEILEGVLDLLSDPEHWNKGCYAKTSDGTKTDGRDPEAVTFCTVGAVQKVVGPHTLLFLDVVCHLNRFSTGQTITVYNDDPQTTHEDIILLLKNALYQAREERP